MFNWGPKGRVCVYLGTGFGEIEGRGFIYLGAELGEIEGMG